MVNVVRTHGQKTMWATGDLHGQRALGEKVDLHLSWQAKFEPSWPSSICSLGQHGAKFTELSHLQLARGFGIAGFWQRLAISKARKIQGA